MAGRLDRVGMRIRDFFFTTRGFRAPKVFCWKGPAQMYHYFQVPCPTQRWSMPLWEESVLRRSKWDGPNPTWTWLWAGLTFLRLDVLTLVGWHQSRGLVIGVWKKSESLPMSYLARWLNSLLMIFEKEFLTALARGNFWSNQCMRQLV